MKHLKRVLFHSKTTLHEKSHEYSDPDCSADSNSLVSEQTLAIAPPMLRSLTHHRAHSGVRRSYSQQSLKEVLNLKQYAFVKECDGEDLGGPSPRTSGGGSILGSLGLRDSTLASQDLIDVLKAQRSGTGSDGMADSEKILHSMTSEVASCSNTIVVSPQLPPSMGRAKWSVKDYNLIRQVHRGYASDVYEATCKVTAKRVALKVYAVDQLEDIPRVQLSREIRLHAKCNHVNIVQFYAAFVEDLPETPGNSDSKKKEGKDGQASSSEKPEESEQPRRMCRAVVLVVEWAGRGNLLKFIQKQGGVLNEAKAINLVLLPLLKSLQYLHSQGVVHRDIKPENMIFDDDMVLKMADFGLALDLKEERANTRAGTLDYMAPEVLLCPTKASPADHKFEQGSRHYTTGADAWAVGAIFYELLVGAPPFRSDSMNTTARNIINCEVSFPSRISSSARDFITACLHVDPSERPTVVDLIQHKLLIKMRKRASYRVAAMRSNSFVEFIEQQQRQEQRQKQLKEFQRTGSIGDKSFLDAIGNMSDEETEDDGAAVFSG